MSVAVASRAPSLENAKVAAEAFGEAYENVEDVLVFGSVARGDADADSDIDLLVLVSEKVDKKGAKLSYRLPQIAKTASGVHCDVVVRTAFQWEHLVTNVSASFEAGIEPETLRLFHREPSQRQHLQGSLNGVPANNAEVAAKHASGSARRLESLARAVEAFLKNEEGTKGFDHDPLGERDLEYAQEILELSHDVLELSVKSIGAAVDSKAPERTHKLDVLVNGLRENSPESHEIIETIGNILEPLRTERGELKDWHGVVAYGGAEEDFIEGSTIDNAFNHFEAALAMTRVTIGELDKLAPVSKQTAEASERLTIKITLIENNPHTKAELERLQHNRDTPERHPDLGF